MLRACLIAAVLLFGCKVFAAGDVKVPVGDQKSEAAPKPELKAETSTGPSETKMEQVGVVHRHSLAAHLGLTSDEAVFRAPRNMRSSELNTLGLEDDIGGERQPATESAKHP